MISKFYLPHTHELYRYLPLLPSHKVSLLCGWYSLHLSLKVWPLARLLTWVATMRLFEKNYSYSVIAKKLVAI